MIFDAAMERTKFISKHTPGTQWNEKRTMQAYLLALLGFTDHMIAEEMGVQMRTLEYWKKTKPEFMAKLTEGKTHADGLVANELFKNCFDHYIDEEQVVVYRGQPTKIKTKRLIPSSDKAQITWLRLRQKRIWSETNNIQFNQTNIKIDNVDMSIFNDQELMILKKAGFSQLPQHYDEQ